MTDLSLPALREAVAKMTPGPWLDNGTEATDEDCQEVILEAPPRYDGEDFDVPVDGDMDRRKADIAGIVALRNAASALLDELEATRRELRDNDVRGMCIIEAAVRSPSISDYMNHWEGRCLKAEADLAAARAVLDGAGVEFEDPRISYTTIQVDRTAWQAWQAVKEQR